MTMLTAVALLAGCRVDFKSNPDPTPIPTPSPSPSPSPTPTPGQTVRANFNFDRDFGGWSADYADYSQGMEAGIAFSATIAAVPPQVAARTGLRLSTQNRSDDVLVYVWRMVEGLTPNARYRVDTDLTIASNVPEGCAGAGGSPGEAVFVKAGAAPRQPAKQVSGNFVSANFDYGSQANSGNEARVIGTIATRGAGSCAGESYALKRLTSNGLGPTITADASGRLWAVIATDSGFEGLTTVWLLDGTVTFTPV